jgi:A/G-specific adenine glycosylase
VPAAENRYAPLDNDLRIKPLFRTRAGFRMEKHTNTKPPKAAAIRRALHTWYRRHRRSMPWRDTRDPYFIWLSEVMLQQTQVKTVMPYFKRFVAAYPDIASLAGADPQAVLKLWEGLGYYRRAHHLMEAARKIVRECKGRLPTEREAFRALPGVGDYIANAVMSIAFDQPWAVVDGNVKRVLARLFRMDAPVNRPAAHARFQAAADDLLDRADPALHNQALMELGALICSPRRPDCPACPLSAQCRAFREGVVDGYPIRDRKPAVPEHALVAGVVMKHGKILLLRRPDEGFLAGLWEFPGGRRRERETASRACRRIIDECTGLTVTVGETVARVRHAYTHFKITLEVMACRWERGRVRLDGPAAFRWVRPSELPTFPLPGALKKVLPHLAHFPKRLDT